MRISSLIKYIINVIIGIAQFILGLRILLKLFGADTVAPFVGWVYDTSSPLLNPFEGIFPTTSIDGTFIIEFSALFAFIFYTLVGYFLTQLVIMFDTEVKK